MWRVEHNVDHVVLQCPIHRPTIGLHGQAAALDDETIEWLLNTCLETQWGQAVDCNNSLTRQVNNIQLYRWSFRQARNWTSKFWDYINCLFFQTLCLNVNKINIAWLCQAKWNWCCCEELVSFWVEVFIEKVLVTLCVCLDGDREQGLGVGSKMSYSNSDPSIICNSDCGLSSIQYFASPKPVFFNPVLATPEGSSIAYGLVASRYFMYTAVLHLLYSSFRWGLCVIMGCYNGSW